MTNAGDDLLSPFLRLALFRDLDRDHLQAILAASDRVLFQPGETIIERNAKTAGAVLIVAGTARRIAAADGAVVDEPLAPGVMLSEMAMLVETEASSTVRAESSIKALTIRPGALRAVMEAEPEIAHHFERVITSRLGALAAELRQIDQTLASGSDQPTEDGRAEPMRAAG